MSSTRDEWGVFSGQHDGFKRQCSLLFRFLHDDYGFTLREINEDGRGSLILYMNDTTGISVSWDSWDEYIAVHVIRIPGKNTYNISAPRWSVDQLMSVKDSAWEQPKQHPDIQITEESMIRILSQYAEALRDHGDAVLKGDYSVFDGIDGIWINPIVRADPDQMRPAR